VGAGSLWPRKQRANKELKDGNLEKNYEKCEKKVWKKSLESLETENCVL